MKRTIKTIQRESDQLNHTIAISAIIALIGAIVVLDFVGTLRHTGSLF